MDEDITESGVYLIDPDGPKDYDDPAGINFCDITPKCFAIQL